MLKSNGIKLQQVEVVSDSEFKVFEESINK